MISENSEGEGRLKTQGSMKQDWSYQGGTKSCHWIPIQTLQFLTALPTHQDGIKKAQ